MVGAWWTADNDLEACLPVQHNWLNMTGGKHCQIIFARFCQKTKKIVDHTSVSFISFCFYHFAPPLQITIYFFLPLQLSGVTCEWHIGRLEDRKRSRPKVYSFSNHSRWRNLSKGSPQLRGALKIWKEVFPSNSEPKSCLQKADMNHTPQTRVELKIETFHPGSSRRGAEAQNTSTHLSKVYGPWWW